MKTYNIISQLGSLAAAVAVLLAGAMVTSCNSDDIDDGAMYTFTGETVSSFCHNTPELSLFAQLIDRNGANELLKVYGNFTCFVPSNAAIETYLAEKGITMETISEEQVNKVVNNCIIREASQAYTTDKFEIGALPAVSMADREIVISYGENATGGQNQILINKQSEIISRDNEVHNGVVHVVNKVVEPSEKTLLEVLQSDGRFNVWAQAYEASGYNKDMEKLYNDKYENTFGSVLVNYPGTDWNLRVPEYDKLGYTLFAEPDELLARSGITNLNTLEEYASRYYGREDLGNYTSTKNPLNRFVAYHLLNRQMSTNSFVYNGMLTTPEWASQRAEYYETYYTYRLMEIKAGNRINERKDGTYIGVSEGNSNIEAVNGYVHSLTSILVYDEDVMRNDVLHKRIRFDFFACVPQFTNNHIRWNLLDLPPLNGVTVNAYTVTPTMCGEYFTYNEACWAIFWASNGWASYQADEINMKKGYDFTFRMLPLPPGNWEMRLGYRSEAWRGMAQLFIDGQIAGTPVDLKIGEIEGDPRIGWVADDQTADNGVENDKLMRNLGYMKAPESIWYAHSGYVLRDLRQALRYIVGQYQFNEYAPHTFRARSVDFQGREFSADYVEFIPVDMIRDEDRG